MIVDGYCVIGQERETRLSAGELLDSMTATRVDRAVIAPEDREIAVNNVRGNDRVLALAQRHRDRFIPACTVNPWLGADAIKELRRCAALGARLLVLHPVLQGFAVNDGMISELVHGAGVSGIPVYLHSGCHASGSPAQIFYTALKYPETKFIMGHCGSTDYAWDMLDILKQRLPNLWYDLSFVRPWCIPGYGQICEDRLIWASGAPRNSQAWELENANRCWPMESHIETYGENFLKLIQAG